MLIVQLFVSYSHVNLCRFFSSYWCRGLAAASACGSSWAFLFAVLEKKKLNWPHMNLAAVSSNLVINKTFKFNSYYSYMYCKLFESTLSKATCNK